MDCLSGNEARGLRKSALERYAVTDEEHEVRRGNDDTCKNHVFTLLFCISFYIY